KIMAADPPYFQDYLQAHLMMAEALLKYSHVKLHSFHKSFALITEEKNYRDIIHYTTEVADILITEMAQGRNQIKSLEEFKINQEKFAQFVEQYNVQDDVQEK
ncbi:MAG: hypothetical protein H7267_14050, partial [Sandarakinorhabdus sp.]|nr:hypothetical protein [Sandarakinorhabdus sp.]